MDRRQSLITMVSAWTGLDAVGADRVTRATLDAFFERLSGGEARALAERLPPEFLRPVRVMPNRQAEPFDLDEFLRRVGEGTGADAERAAEYAEAVLTALRVLVGPDSYDDAVAQLPADFAEVAAGTRRADLHVGSAMEFVARVADRTGLRVGDAWAATDAVLETLGERIPREEVHRLVNCLPSRLREPLERGTEQVTAVRGMGADKFVEVVAERENSTPEQAQRHTSAVLGAVAAAVPEDDFYDAVVTQLPNDYADLLVAR